MRLISINHRPSSLAAPTVTMSVPNTLRCLLRPSAATSISQRIAPVTALTAPFSSSSILAKNPTPPSSKTKGGLTSRAKVLPGGHIRAGKKMQLGKFKKNRQVDRSRPPAPGERKAYRKRVTLSNNNALPVEGLEELSAQNMVDPAKVGRMLALPNELVDQLRAVEAFKHTQTWNMFRQPSMLQRKEARELAEKMQAAAGKGETLKLVISGDRLVGKSMLLLQAISYAYLNNWIVFHIPEGLCSPRIVGCVSTQLLTAKQDKSSQTPQPSTPPSRTLNRPSTRSKPMP